MSEWIEYGKRLGPLWESDEKGYAISPLKRILDTFVEEGFMEPGVLFETRAGERFLVGHMDSSGGNCCGMEALEPEDIVTRYKIVWREEDEDPIRVSPVVEIEALTDSPVEPKLPEKDPFK